MSLGAPTTLVLSHGMVWHASIPRAPENLHLFRKAKRHANVLFVSSMTSGDEHAFRTQHSYYFRAGPSGGHQNKIGMGMEGTQHAGICL